jgi:hypothetical protein
MQHSQLTESVRQLVGQAFAELGSQSPDWRETILIRDGSYCGRRFEGDAGAAIWFVEEDQIKIYRQDGAVARVISPVEPLSLPSRAAA